MSIRDLAARIFHPRECYGLFAVARSGAHLLTRALQATHLAGRPLQYFNEELAPKYAARYELDSAHIADYLRGLRAAASTDNGVFGFRLDAWDLDRTVARLRECGEFGPNDSREIDILRNAFPGLRCIQLTREDKLRQGISKARAMQTNLWLVGKENEVKGEAKFDVALIEHCLDSSANAEKTFADFFARTGIEPLAITYENLCDDYAGTVLRVLDFLRIRLPRGFVVGAPTTTRQADATTDEWMARYRSLGRRPV
jgi:LPS sulfotransferase NodH